MAERTPSPASVAFMRRFIEAHGRLQADIAAITLAAGLGRLPTNEEIDYLEQQGRELVVDARAMRNLCGEIIQKWRRGEHHTPYEEQGDG